MQEAHNLAGKWNQRELAPEHLFLAFLSQEEGVVSAVLRKIGVAIPLLRDEVSKAARGIVPGLAKALVAEHGRDPVYGARPLKRAIRKYVVDPLSTMLLEGTFRDGQHLVADVKDGALCFSVQAS